MGSTSVCNGPVHGASEPILFGILKIMKNSKSKSQIEVTANVLSFLGDRKIQTPEDLTDLRNNILDAIEFKPYNEQTEKHADSIQWKRTASEIIQDGYVYDGIACSDIAIVFLSLCKAAGVEGYLLKLITEDNSQTHTIVEVELNSTWYRLDPSTKSSIPFAKQMTSTDTFRGKYKLWKKGRDNWDLGLDSFESMDKIHIE